MRNGVVIFLIVWLCFPFWGKAQEEKVEMYEVPDTLVVSEFTELPDTLIIDDLTELPDTLRAAEADSLVQAVLMAADKDMVAEDPPLLQVKSAFKPDPNKALLFSLVPGMGQIYNRKYWKLPIVYGAMMGCTYAITWNNRNYQDYWTAYKDVMYDAENKVEPADFRQSWQDFLRVGESAESMVNNSNFHSRLKSRKDYFRRYRDLSIIISVGVYVISVLDAYVDAQLFDFDISPDLSMRVEPVVTPKTRHSSSTVGLNCSINF